MKLKHLIWDWNGTLLDDAQACALAVDQMTQRRGLGKMPIERYRDMVEFPVRPYYAKMGFDLETEDYDAVCNEYIAAYQGHPLHIALQPDALAVLESALAQGVTHAVVSASEEAILRRQIAQFGLSTYFVRIYGRSDHHAGSKAHLLLDWMKQCGFAPQECLYVGDTMHDVEVAEEAGIPVALVGNGHVAATRLMVHGVPVFDNLTALWDALTAQQLEIKAIQGGRA